MGTCRDADGERKRRGTVRFISATETAQGMQTERFRIRICLPQAGPSRAGSVPPLLRHRHGTGLETCA